MWFNIFNVKANHGGVVYESPYVDGAKVDIAITSKDEDRNIRDFFIQRNLDRDTYTVDYYNCRLFSQLMLKMVRSGVFRWQSN